MRIQLSLFRRIMKESQFLTWPLRLKGWIPRSHLVVIDDASTDNTARLAANADAVAYISAFSAQMHALSLN